jgi:hypothetical protein
MKNSLTADKHPKAKQDSKVKSQEKKPRWIEGDAATRHPNLVRFSWRVRERVEQQEDQ